MFAPVTYPFIHLVFNALSIPSFDAISKDFVSLWEYDCDGNSRQRIYDRKISKLQFFEVDDVHLIPPEGLSDNIEVRLFMRNLYNLLRQQKQHRLNFNYSITNLRSTLPKINFHWDVVRAVTCPPTFSDSVIISRCNNRLARYITPTWYELIRTMEERLIEYDIFISRFVFVLPRAITLYGDTRSGIFKHLKYSKDEMILNQSFKYTFDTIMKPFYSCIKRQKIFFPDRKLVQFDSGKLQTLHTLLRERKQGGHKCLIFTQMSKMLDILEIFLNLHSYTYVRLDGSTGIDLRQKLMDRFNGDPKLFCFILSTRSGGLGINLTGADTVIFYDSDWNPAMDAQAQDRAHRIGQTREVHIYRLVCSSTVEENILVKAKQKRHLDFLVMTEGNFSETSLFSSSGLKDVLGIDSMPTNTATNSICNITATNSEGNAIPMVVDEGMNNTNVTSKDLSSAEFEALMNSVEDEDDVKALKGAKAEVEQDMEEFSESAPIPRDDDDGDSKSESSKPAEVLGSQASDVGEEKDLEQEFASWQATVGPDFSALQAALKPIERYALKIRTDIEPYYSVHWLSEQERLREIEGEQAHNAIDLDVVEREKQEEEIRVINSGELVVGNMSKYGIKKLKSLFLKEKAARERKRRRRVMTGEGWSIVIDPVSNVPFWYNDDTGDASYATPKVVADREAFETALERRFNGIPKDILVHVFRYLDSYPDRMNSAPVCARWYEAARDESFQLRVLPVELLGTLSSNSQNHNDGIKLKPHTFANISSALLVARAGDVISLGPGHHWETSLSIYVPVKIVGEGEDSSRCVVEITGQINVHESAMAIALVALTVRRPKRLAEAYSCLSCTSCNISVRYFLICLKWSC